MNYKKLFATFSLFILLFVCFASLNVANAQSGAQTKVAIETNFGTMKVVLYNETPLHRDNFIKMVNAHYYDSLLFHRCIQNFMIQGGDPDSKYAPSDFLLGDGGPNYTIPAEFNSSLYHKKGALAAARESDLDNVNQASSASQFYIVQGRVFTDSLLRTNQAKRITKMRLFNEIINKPEYKSYLEKYKAFAKAKNTDSVKVIYDFFNQKVDKEFESAVLYKFTDEQVKTYSTIGGTPHLDLSYTVFGEVIEGLDIIDKIAAQKTDSNNRPLNEVRIIKMSIIP
jgi:peptidyl-prolyl cis-trans isomerase B (cyclophilin B)